MDRSPVFLERSIISFFEGGVVPGTAEGFSFAVF